MTEQHEVPGFSHRRRFPREGRRALRAAGDVYTSAELERMFRNAGFAKSELRELPRSFQRAVVSYKAS